MAATPGLASARGSISIRPVDSALVQEDMYKTQLMICFTRRRTIARYVYNTRKCSENATTYKTPIGSCWRMKRFIHLLWRRLATYVAFG